MNNTVFQEALSFAQQVSKPHSPYGLCRTLGIEIISDKPMHKDGYLVCRDGCKLIFINSLIHNLHRRKFIVSHELGHFLLHRDSLYCCDNILEIGTSSINTSRQEYEANKFASEYLMPQEELISLLPSKPLQFSDISKIASHFNVSMTSAAFRSVKLSKSEDEILICYDGQRLKWFSSADRTLNLDDIPSHCPVNLSKVPLISDITGAWDSLYDGPVHQEIFQPFGNQKLVLLSGNRTSMEEAYCEL